MATIKLTNKTTGKKELVNASNITRVADNGTEGVTVCFTDGTEENYNESLRSVNGYIKKAEAGSQEDSE